MTPYALARIIGNVPVAEAIRARGVVTPLTPIEATLARIADGEPGRGINLDPATLPEAVRNIVRMILHLPGKLPHVQRLVDAGVEYDLADEMGLTPVQLAGWEGLPEVMAYLLSLKPDLTHVNGYGGTLLSPILHGAENRPQRAERDYVACLRLALDEGVPLPRRAIELAGAEEIVEFLSDWAERHPEQVVDGGVG